jgi:F0F1-type ATP synthase membrane subunit b/b'
MSIENLTAQVNSLSQIVSGLVVGQSSHSHSSGPSAADFEEIQNQIKDLKVQMKVIQSEAKSTARVAASQASQASKAGMMNVLEGAITPVVQMVADSEKASARQVRDGIASIATDVTAAKAIASAHTHASMNLLTQTLTTFARG